MSRAGLDACLALHRAHANLQLKLDDVLGTFHGLGWHDFSLLSALAAAPEERLPRAELGRLLGLSMFGVVRRLAPLERLGLLAREGAGSTTRVVALRQGGRRLIREAADTAADICAAALAELPPGALLAANMNALADTHALRLR